MALEVMVLVLTLGLCAALAAQRWLDRRSWPVWSGLDALTLRSVLAMRDSLRGRARLVAVTLEGVEQERRAGERREASDLLRLSVQTLERFVCDVSRRLGEWAEAARALAAVCPLPPLGVGAVHLARLRALTAFWHVLHVVAVTSRERFLLRVAVLRRGLAALLRFWRAARLPRDRRPEWRAPAIVSHDVRALADAAGDTYEALVMSRLSEPATASVELAERGRRG